MPVFKNFQGLDLLPEIYKLFDLKGQWEPYVTSISQNIELSL